MRNKKLKEVCRYLVAAAGITIGVFVLVSVLVLMDGGKAVLRRNFWSQGLRVYDISLSAGGGSGEYLHQEDGNRLREKMPQIRGSIPMLKAEARLASYRKSLIADTLGVNEGYLNYANLKMLKGTFFTGEDVRAANKVALLDDLTALELFGTTNIKGQKLDIQAGGSNEEFTVIGVFRNFGRNIETIFEEEIPGICIIPYSVPAEEGMYFDMEQLTVMIDGQLHSDKAAAMLKHILEREHGNEGVYKVNEYKQLPETARFIDKYLVFAVIACLIGVLSGGVGVMNAMLLTLRNRKREIGIYRFFGAGTRQLRDDLIYRALALCLCSSGLGLMAGIAAGGFLGSMFNIPLSFPASSIFAAAVAGTAAGLGGSLYPAASVSSIDISAAIWDE